MNLNESPEYRSGEHFADEVLNALRDGDVDLTESQPFQFYLYLETETEARACATELQLIGLETEVVDPNDMEDEEFDDDETELPEELTGAINDVVDQIFEAQGDEDDEEDARWLCLASTQMEPTRDRFTEIGDKMLSLAKQYKGEFEGWEVNPDTLEQAMDEIFGNIADQLGGLLTDSDDVPFGDDDEPEEFLALVYDEIVGDLEEDLAPEAHQFFNDACGEFNIKQNRLREEWRFDECDQWSFDQETGDFRLDFEDGSQLLADGQIAGSVDMIDNGWEWAWNNPNIQDSVAQDSKLVRELGEKFEVECLRTGITPTPGGPFPAFLAAVSVKATDSIGAYPAIEGDFMAFILLKNLKWFSPETN